MKSRSFTAKVQRGFERLRQDGVLATLLHYLERAGIEIRPFYYIKEVLPSAIPDRLTAIPNGFAFSVFGREEVMAISKLAERKGYVGEQHVINNFRNGDTCLGLKYHGDIAAFTWFSLKQIPTAHLYEAQMAMNEAYLYDMYVLKAFRGNNLAPILRHKNYEILKRMGRDTFYSATEHFNTASFRFKAKLNARVIFLALYVEIFNRYRIRWILRRY
jgi:hypothetical protein